MLDSLLEATELTKGKGVALLSNHYENLEKAPDIVMVDGVLGLLITVV